MTDTQSLQQIQITRYRFNLLLPNKIPYVDTVAPDHTDPRATLSADVYIMVSSTQQRTVHLLGQADLELHSPPMSHVAVTGGNSWKPNLSNVTVHVIGDIRSRDIDFPNITTDQPRNNGRSGDKMGPWRAKTDVRIYGDSEAPDQTAHLI